MLTPLIAVLLAAAPSEPVDLSEGKPAPSDASMSAEQKAAGEQKAAVEQCARRAPEKVAATVEDPVCARALDRELAAKLPSTLASGALAVDLMQALGQVVLDKASQAGWDLLRRRVEDLACTTGLDGQPHAPATCAVVRDEANRIQDLLAQPELLVRAVLADWSARVGARALGELAGPVLAGLSPAELWDAWRRNGVRGLESAARQGLLEALTLAARAQLCPAQAEGRAFRTEAALWAIGRWLALGQQHRLADILAACEGVPDADRREIVRLFTAHRGLFARGSDDAPSGRVLARDAIHLVLALAQLDLPERTDELDDLRELLTGLLEGDWTRATAAARRRLAAELAVRQGALTLEATLRLRLAAAAAAAGTSEGRSLTDAEWTSLRPALVDAARRARGRPEGVGVTGLPPALPPDVQAELQQLDAARVLAQGTAADEPATRRARKQEQARSDALAQLVGFLAGVGRYAASYRISDADAATEARKDAIADLVARMASRRERTRGVVWSLGGSLAGVVGFREAIGGAPGKVWASPVHLGLGFAADTYHNGRSRAARAMGLHLEVSAVDLGQYVVFESKGLTLERPDLKAAISPSAKIAFRFAGRAVPTYVGAFGALSPFVRTDQADHMTWTFGAVLGVYIPFVDFN